MKTIKKALPIVSSAALLIGATIVVLNITELDPKVNELKVEGKVLWDEVCPSCGEVVTLTNGRFPHHVKKYHRVVFPGNRNITNVYSATCWMSYKAVEE